MFMAVEMFGSSVTLAQVLIVVIIVMTSIDIMF